MRYCPSNNKINTFVLVNSFFFLACTNQSTRSNEFEPIDAFMNLNVPHEKKLRRNNETWENSNNGRPPTVDTRHARLKKKSTGNFEIDKTV